jgi:thiamine-phosphate pyrophosphorylase
VILCLVTDRRRRSVIEQTRDASRAGVDLIQLREPDLAAAALSSLAARLADVTRDTATRIVVNDRLDVALTCGASGVHLRGDSIPPSQARAMSPHGFLIGRSVRAVDEAIQAARHADYLIAGTVFPTASKPGLHEHLGVDGLAAIVKAVPIPVLAIGGVTMDRMDAVARAGAAGVAAITLFDADADTLSLTVRDARRRFDSARFGSLT